MIRRERGRLVIEFQSLGRRVFRRLPACSTEEDAQRIEDQLKRQIFEDCYLDGKPSPGQRAAMHKIDPSEWTRVAGLLLSACPIKPKSGVYFLCQRGRLVYIGRSKNVAVRLGGHLKKSFDHACMIEVPPSKLAETEEYLIRMFQPKLNCTLTGQISPKLMGFVVPKGARPATSALYGPVAQSVRAGDS